MSRRKNFRQSNWLIELSPRKNVEPRFYFSRLDIFLPSGDPAICKVLEFTKYFHLLCNTALHVNFHMVWDKNTVLNFCIFLV